MFKSVKNLRSIIITVLSLVIVIAMIAGCSSGQTVTETTASDSAAETTTADTSAETTQEETQETTEPVEMPEVIRVAGLNGPTGMGMASMVEESENGNLDLNYEFSFAGAPDELTAKIISGQLDIAALPTNLAAVLYQKTEQEIQLLALNTLGVLYVLESGDSVQTFTDLADKEIFATGQGAVPEYVLSKLLADYEIADTTTVTFKTEHTELATLAISGQADLVMLPEPFVTNVLGKREDMRIALDMTQVWQENQERQNKEGNLAMGCLVVSKSFADQYPEAVEQFLADYKNSTDFTNANPEAAGELIAKHGIMADADLAAKAIPNCYITMISGGAMKPMLEPLFEALLEANPQAVGGAIPDAGFYYGANE